MPSGDSDPVYSISTVNKYGMIDIDCEDPSELIRAAQEKPKKEKEPKTKGKKDTKTTEKKTVKIETPADKESSENKRNDRGPRNERGRGRGRGRGGRGGGERGRGRGGYRNNNFSPNSDNNNQGGFGFDNNNQGGFGSYQTQVAETNEGGFNSGGFGGNDGGEERRGGRSGFRGGRGGRGGRGRGRGGNREFDRRSGSDKSSVKPSDKRDGSGSYNWGSPQDEINAASEETGGFGTPGGFGAPKENEETPATETTEQTQETEEVAEPEPVDEGPQEMTFEEYKKQQAESRKKPEFNLRKVEQDKKGLKQLKKATEKENEAKGSLFFPEMETIEMIKTSGREKKTLEGINIRYGSGGNRHMDTSRRGGRGGRGGGRRDGNNRDRDGGKSKVSELALTNDKEFPSLS